jgi:hypothetical protein
VFYATLEAIHPFPSQVVEAQVIVAFDGTSFFTCYCLPVHLSALNSIFPDI